MGSLLLFLLVLSVLVIGHELGHYVAARMMGVKVEEFGYGFPPRILGFLREGKRWKKIGKDARGSHARTIWSINWLPLGGFVRLKGEDGAGAHETDAFAAKNPLARFFILSAGVLMNLVIAAVIFTIGFSIGVPAQTDRLPAGAVARDLRAQVSEVVPDSAAARAGIKAGDFILAVDGRTVTRAEEIRSAMTEAGEKGRSISLHIQQENGSIAREIRPTFFAETGRYVGGVYLTDTGIVRLPVHQAFIQGISLTASFTGAIFSALGDLLKGFVGQNKVDADVTGPIGIAVMTGRIASQGWWPLMQFSALLSINLAIINFLPIPALDGGRVLFVLIEAIRRKRTDARVEALVHQIGFLALLILVAAVTFHDLRVYGGTIVNGLKGTVGL